MKPVGRLCKSIAFGVLAAAAFAVSNAEAAQLQNKAVVRAVRGTATYSTDKGATWKSVRVGFIFRPGAIVRTADQSSVDLFLGDNGPVVRITEATQLGIDKLGIEQTAEEAIIETELDLRNGRILGNVKKLAAASTYEVKTPLGVAGIRGTEYDISANGTVHVVTGTVVVVYINRADPANPHTVTVREGETAYPPADPAAVPTVAPTPADVKVRVLQDTGDVAVVVVQYTPATNPPVPPESPVQTVTPEPPAPPPGVPPPPTPVVTPKETPFVSPAVGKAASSDTGTPPGNRLP